VRLNGRREIMAYLGRSSRNKNGWRKVRARYGDVIHCYSESGHVWALAEELDELDRERSLTLPEVLASRGTREGAVGEDVGDMQLESLVRKFYPSAARKRA